MTDRLSPRFWHAALALLLTLGVALPAQATHKDDGVFHFNISPNGYPPYLIVDGETPSGIMWDVVNLVLPRMGYQVEPKRIPRKRVDNMLADGYIDATPRAIEWTRSPEDFSFTDAIVQVEEVFFFPEDSDLEFNSLDDLVGTTIVTPLGYVYPALEPFFADGRIQRFEVAHERNMFRYLLHSDEFDAALADRLVGRWLLSHEGMTDQFRSSQKSISRLGFRLMVRKDWTDFTRRFNRQLATIRNNGELADILTKYR
jgi:polar amino acid transport system substrate-binding protein